MEMMQRALLGAIAAGIVTGFARKFDALDESGQWAAFACAILTAASGWPWAGTLIVFFVAASAITRVGAARKAERTQHSTPQVPTRDLYQVAANGLVYTLLAFRAKAAPESTWGIGAAGALAAASADTWATEVGTLWGGRPRSIMTGRPVAPGMSGGVTLVGSAGALVGAAIVVATVAALFRLPYGGRAAAAIFTGGMTGAFADSVLGATVQARRWCENCKQWTERRVHPCSYRTVHAAGVRWVSNDVVNLLTTAVGAAVAIATFRYAR